MPNVMTAHTQTHSVAVVDEQTDRCRELARTTGLAFGDATTHTYTLQWLEDKLTLRSNNRQPGNSLSGSNNRKHSAEHTVDTNIDFTAGRTLHRLKYGGGHGQAMARAVKTSSSPVICDATAGFGKDAFVFASLGCTVVLLERSIVVHALLQDALQRACKHPDIKPIVKRMTLHLADSSQLPACWPEKKLPEIIYLDPMYPQGKRSAKKEIQSLRILLDKQHADRQQDEAALLNAALGTARRVVVKRPLNATPLADCKPSGNITSPNTRYDIYAGKP